MPIEKHICTGRVGGAQGTGAGDFGHASAVDQECSSYWLSIQTDNAKFGCFGEVLQDVLEQAAAIDGRPQVSHVPAEDLVERRQQRLPAPVDRELLFFRFADLITDFGIELFE